MRSLKLSLAVEQLVANDLCKQLGLLVVSCEIQDVPGLEHKVCGNTVVLKTLQNITDEKSKYIDKLFFRCNFIVGTMDQLQPQNEAMLDTNLRSVQCTCNSREDVIQCTRWSFIEICLY